MGPRTQRPPNGPSPSIVPNNNIGDKNPQNSPKNSTNFELLLRIFQDFQSDPLANPLVYSVHSITLKEYRHLLDLLSDLKDIRYIWGRNRYEVTS